MFLFKSLFSKRLVSWSQGSSSSSGSHLLLLLLHFLLGHPQLRRLKARGVSWDLPHLLSEGSALSSCSQISFMRWTYEEPFRYIFACALSSVKRTLSSSPAHLKDKTALEPRGSTLKSQCPCYFSYHHFTRSGSLVNCEPKTLI